MKWLPRLAFAGLALAACSGCRAFTGGAEQDATEAKRELAARGEGGGEQSLGPDAVKVAADMEPMRPEVDVRSEGFEESSAGEAVDMLAEIGVIVLLAALATGFVRLYQRRLPLLGFLLGAVACVLSALAFLNSAT